MSIRKAVFAGSWYPAGADACETEIKSFLKESCFHVTADKPFKAGIVPHAGWYFSGSLACNVIAALAESDRKNPPDVIVIFGMHLHPRSAPCIMAEGAWETPFGNLDIETHLAKKLMAQFTFNIETPTHFHPENTIELQTPFVKYFFPKSRLIPIGAPPNEISLELGTSVAELSRQMGLAIKVIGSTDLTHYGPNYGFMPAGRGAKALSWAKEKNDKQIIDCMLAMDAERVIQQGLKNMSACCPGAAAAAISAAKSLGAGTGRLAGYRSSAEKNPGDSFVGYTGIVFQ